MLPGGIKVENIVPTRAWMDSVIDWFLGPQQVGFEFRSFLQFANQGWSKPFLSVNTRLMHEKGYEKATAK